MSFIPAVLLINNLSEYVVLGVGRDEVVVFQLGQHDVVIDAVHVLVEVEHVPVVVLEQQLGPCYRFLAVLLKHLHEIVPLAEVIADGLGQRVDLIAQYDIGQEENPLLIDYLGIFYLNDS